MSKVTLHCSKCGCVLAWEIPCEDDSICSSAYVEGFSLCHDCLTEHCLNTSCLCCKLGKYPECMYIETKKYYMNYKEDDT
jgi:hypothetical protein